MKKAEYRTMFGDAIESHYFQIIRTYCHEKLHQRASKAMKIRNKEVGHHIVRFFFLNSIFFFLPVVSCMIKHITARSHPVT